MTSVNLQAWGEKSFSSAGEFGAWVDQQIDLYRDLCSSAAGQSYGLGQFSNNLSSTRDCLNKTPPDTVAAKSKIDSTFKQFKFPPAESADGRFLAVFRNDPDFAARVVQQLRSHQLPTRDNTAAYLVAIHKYPLLTSNDENSFGQASSQAVVAAEAATNKLNSALQAFASERAAFLKGVADDAGNAASTQREKIESEWAQLNKKYDSQLALQAPRTYWSRVRKNNLKLARIAEGTFRRVSIFTVIIAVILLGGIWIPTTQRLGDIPLTIWVLSGAILGIAFWVVRLYSRMYLSREHLARDAEERVTMIETYLALVEHGRVKDEDLKFVLSSIFRHTEDGLVRDDALPSPLLDLFQQGKGRP